MSENEMNLTDAEWDAKLNGPREALLEELFGKTPCPVSDISPVVRVIDKNWNTKKSFMDPDYPRITTPMNVDMTGVGEINEQIHLNNGKIVTRIRQDQLQELKEVPAPIK